MNNKKNEVSIEYDDDATEQTLFSAKAVYIGDDTDQKFEEILQSVKSDTLQISHESDKINDDTELVKSPTNQSVAESFISSSSLDDSIKIYNVQTGEIVTCKAGDKLSEDRRDTKHDCDDNADTLDNKCEEKTDERILRECNGADDGRGGAGVRKKMSIDELDLPKVKDLARIFVPSMEPVEQQDTVKVPPRRRKGSQDNILNGDTAKSDKANKQAYMHSLTARSISKEFRDELRLSMATPLKVPGGSNELPEGIEDVIKESSRPGSPLPEPGTLKTKLAFFESLKSKFNGKS
ncbi:hypothetical protein EVAR_83322_1 [Eumeta japonica]|uniref:Uncharacterized protein n=1 Tax=Eumeta variegata TaxID=151549 RepID=A0A4C1VYB5_EUMVA|nr:hypothetical protein EVAR_83322_1 [Eumeta japonica]